MHYIALQMCSLSSVNQFKPKLTCGDNIQWNFSIWNSMKIYSVIPEQLNAHRRTDRHNKEYFYNFSLQTHTTHFTLTNTLFAMLRVGSLFNLIPNEPEDEIHIL
jgi:hypothetical protein